MLIIEKNTVKAQGQLKPSQFVTFHHSENGGLRVMFVGNSITLHGKLPEIGWHWNHGMAASSEEKDYVHLTEKAILKKHPDAAFCVCQVAEWERNYKNGTGYLELFSAARKFCADVIVMRLSENCTEVDDAGLFLRQFDALLAYLNGSGQAKVAITTSFWPKETDEPLRRYAEAGGYPLIELSDLGQDQRMMALGLFEHMGVQHHPGDLGMQAISDRILACMHREKMI